MQTNKKFLSPSGGLFSGLFRGKSRNEPKTITIGTQIWMAENLNVNHYRNGDKIQQVQDGEAWSKLTTGAWCCYDNKNENGDKYGKLYNWYAISDSRGLAPEGFHIPSLQEWQELSKTLGGNEVAAEKMKADIGWNDDKGKSGNGTNNSGFTALPGGWRTKDMGWFAKVGNAGHWWSSTNEKWGDGSPKEVSAYLLMVYFSNGLNIYFDHNRHGMSVRCIKDK